MNIFNYFLQFVDETDSSFHVSKAKSCWPSALWAKTKFGQAQKIGPNQLLNSTNHLM